MSYLKVDTPQTEMYELPETGDVEFTKKAKITVKAGTVAIRNSGELDSRTVILHNDITVSCKLAEAETAIGFDNADCLGKITLRADSAVKLTVTATVADGDAAATAILLSANARLSLGSAGESYRQTIAVTATANGKNADFKAEAVGISALQTVTFAADLAAPITVKAVTKTDAARAVGISAGDIAMAGVGAALTVAATGMESATAIVLNADETLAEDAEGKLTVDGIVLKTVSAVATASDKNSGLVEAVAFRAQTITFTEALKGAVTAKATGKSAGAGSGSAYGFCATGESDCTVDGILGNFTVTLAGVSGTAAAFYAQNAAVQIGGALSGKMNVGASGGATGESYVIYAADGIAIIGALSSAITVTAKGNETATAAGFAAQAGAITLSGALSGKISVTATGTADADVSACAMRTQAENCDIALTSVTGGVTVTAAAQNGAAQARGWSAQQGALHANGVWSGNVTLKATSKSDAAEALAWESGGEDVATMGYMYGTTSVSATGAVAQSYVANFAGGASVTEWRGKVTATATAKSGEADAGFLKAASLTVNGISAPITVTAKGTSAEAFGVQISGALSLADEITAKLNITATATQGSATATGIAAATLGMPSGSIGTLTVNANGKTDADAVGWDLGTVNLTSGGTASGKATVTAKAGSATGMSIGWAMGGTLVLDITATGKEAVGVHFTSVAMLSFQSSKIIAKGSASAFALQEDAMSGGSQSLTFEKTTLIGDVALGFGADTLTLQNNSKLTGDVDMGVGKDTVKIQTGSQLKGNIVNAENIGFFVSDMGSAKAALWEGEVDQTWQGVSLNMNIDPEAVKAGTVALIKDTDGESDWSSTKFKLTLNSLYGGTLRFGEKYIASSGDYDYELTADKAGSTLLLAITKK